MKHLVLAPDTRHHALQDYQRLAAMINALPGGAVRAHLRYRHTLWLTQLGFLFRPTLYVAFRQLRRFRPLRGVLMHGRDLGKGEQYERMQAAGIAVLPWARLVPDLRLDPAFWGKYVVVKPDYGMRGRDVRVLRTGRLRFEKLPREEHWLAQRFAYTGPQPIAYRALTLFGELLYLERTRNHRCGSALAGAEAFGEVGGHNIVAAARGGERELVEDPEVEAHALRVAREAFPEIPLLGMDIVRDLGDGGLYAVEVNPFGNTWHFSSRIGRGMQAEHGFDYAAQRDAFAVAARALAEATLRHAR
jgi:hypothetical protein